MSESTQPFLSNKRDGEDHLTEWALAMEVRREAPLSARQAAHLQQCSHCKAALAEREREHATARAKPMPASLRALLVAPDSAPSTEPASAPAPARVIALASRARPARRPWVAVASSLLAACLVAVLGVSLRNLDLNAAGPVAKGTGVAVLASVLRDGTLVLKDQPLTEVREVRSGDHMRLRLSGAEARSHVVLETLEDEGWTALFDGPLPQNHVLPSGLLLDGNPTHLQLRVCDAHDSHCTTQRFDF